jgi:hypothetical protein
VNPPEKSRFPHPPGEDEIPAHARNYEVRTYRVDASTMRLRGRVTDTKPAGLYVDGDTEPLVVHDMVVDMIVGYPDLTIREVSVVLDTHPHTSCPSIESSYEQLIGASIARGFSRMLTETFGGKMGCTHVGALLRAMAPVAVQSMYSMQLADPDNTTRRLRDDSEEARQRAQAYVRNSCHVWADDGDMIAASEAGLPLEAPIWIRDRLHKLDRLDELTNWQ